LMELLNALNAEQEIFSHHGTAPAPRAFVADVQRTFVLLLAPFAPYLAHELWESLGEKENLLKVRWPKYDAALAKEEEIEIPVQVNGKLRGRVLVPADADETLVKQRALADEKVKAAIAGKQIVKVIFVSGKLLNLVVR
jgi:leucyl-tRNA synthetase